MTNTDNEQLQILACPAGELRPPTLDDPRVLAALESYMAALEAGQPPDPQNYLARHADIAETLAVCLEGLELVRLMSPRLQPAGEEPPPGPMARTAEVQPEGPLGDFRILREVGRGGMGVVYEAEQVSLGRRVALKVLPFAAALDPRNLQRFKNEAHAAAQLHHTNMVPVYYVGCERGTHFYAMQFIDGQTLAGAIADLRLQIADLKKPAGAIADLRLQIADLKKPANDADATRAYPAPAAEAICNLKSAICNPTVVALSTERSIKSPAFFRTVAQLGIQAAEALDHAHQVGIVHRDVKPGNLMVENSPLAPHSSPLRLWVTDFGLAHMQHAEGAITMSGDLIGTLRYMSPEQALAKRVIIDHRTDIYSLGATLYELLTLEPVFTGRDRQELLRQIAFEEPRPPRRLNKAIPVELETIVLKALEKNPADRYATAQELADDLRRFLEDKPVHAKRPSLAQRVRKWGRRHRSVVGATIAVLLLAVVGLAAGTFLLWQEQQRTEHEKQQTQAALARAEEQARSPGRSTTSCRKTCWARRTSPTSPS